MCLVKNALIAIKFRLFNSACAFAASMEKFFSFSFKDKENYCAGQEILIKKASSLSCNFSEKGKLFAFCFTNSIQKIESLKAIGEAISFTQQT
jgi:hypothetical protein